MKFVTNPQSALAVTAIALIGALCWILLFPLKKPFYATAQIVDGEGVTVTMLTDALQDARTCQATLAKMQDALRKTCNICKIQNAYCSENISSRMKNALKGEKIDVPTIRAQNVAIFFEGVDLNRATQICNQTAVILQSTSSCNARTESTLSNALANVSSKIKPGINSQPIQTFLLIFVICLLSSLSMATLIVLTKTWHGRFSLDHTKSGPQKIHGTSVPRIGGLSLVAGICTGLVFLKSTTALSLPTQTGLSLLAASSIPAFAGGLIEDLTKNVGVMARLLLTMSAGALASVLLGATLTHLDFPPVDFFLSNWPLIATLFTAFAVAGVSNAMNIIDGFNGLASGFSLLALSAFSVVAYQVGDQVILLSSIVMLGSCLGFLVWNWPLGRLFLGDGGSYLLGFWLAEIGVLLVVRNPTVSPWFPLAVMIYPVCETLYSYQRRGRSEGMRSPDSLHLHHMIFKSLTRGSHKFFHLKLNENNANNLVALTMLPIITAFLIAGIIFFQNSLFCGLICVAFCLFYHLTYKQLNRRYTYPK